MNPVEWLIYAAAWNAYVTAGPYRAEKPDYRALCTVARVGWFLAGGKKNFPFA